MKPPVTHTSQIVYRGYYDVRKDKLLRPDGQTLDFTSIEMHWDAAVILAQDREGKLIINREYRHPTGQYLLSCPGGKLERGEDVIECGRRELFEETGYRAEEISLMGCCYPIPSICNHKIYYLFAKNAQPGETAREPFEFIITERMSEEQLRQEILSGALVDGVLCTALWYKSLHS